MKRPILIFVVFGLVAAAAYAVYAKQNTVNNVADYMFSGGPYLSRTISYSAVILEPDSAELSDVTYDVEYEDRHWYRLDLDGAINALGAQRNIDPELTNNLRNIDAEFTFIKDRYSGPEKLRSDGLVREIVGLVNRFYIRHKNRGGLNNTRKLLAWPFHAENHLINLASTTTACGTTGEATLALLRDAGFKTRLMGVSHSPRSIVYSHVFLEYFSWEQQKWVMVDPMINEIAESAGRLLSTSEMLQNEQARKPFNKKWKRNGEYSEITDKDDFYKSYSIVFFSNDFGPFKTIYYFSNDADVRRKIKQRVIRQSFKPDWL
jgi:hypothetical protein